MRIGIALLAGAAFAGNAALAYPDGAPWGAANPAAEQHCASCHFGAEAIPESAVLLIDGLPSTPLPGARYELRIVFSDPQIIIAGFQLIAHAGGQDAGTFTSDENGVEFVGPAIRSTAPLKADEGVAWHVAWIAPAAITSPIHFYIAASAANDDGSPFGDTIHYRAYEIPAM